MKKITETLRRLGIRNGLFYMLGTMLHRVSNGRWRMIRYYVVAQPIPSPFIPKARPSPSSTVEPLILDENISLFFPRSKEIIDKRLRAGHSCFVAKVKGRFAGFLWYARNFYEEDEVSCRFVLSKPETSIWDFDVYVEPDFRMGRTLARLWDAANQQLEKEDIRWSFSRISAFNADSLSAHGQLGTRKIATLTFLCLGSIQLLFNSTIPYFHCYWPGRDQPTVIV